jgi:hypothetical protein
MAVFPHLDESTDADLGADPVLLTCFGVDREQIQFEPRQTLLTELDARAIRRLLEALGVWLEAFYFRRPGLARTVSAPRALDLFDRAAASVSDLTATGSALLGDMRGAR